MTGNNKDQPSSTNQSAKDVETSNGSDAAQTFGEWLQKNRVIRRISLEEVAAVTKVHIMQLKALEQNDVTKLPAPAFVRGFLVSYARHLGIDENEVLDRYKNSFGGSLTPIADLLTPTQNRSARSASAPKVAMVSSPHLKQAPSAREVEGAKISPINFRNVSMTVGAIGVVTLIAVLISLGKTEKQKEVSPQAASAPAPTSESVATDAATAALLAQTPDPASGSAKAISTKEGGPTTKTKDSTPVAVAATVNASTPNPSSPSANSSAANAATGTAASASKGADASSASTPSTSPKKYQLEVRAIEPNYVHLRVDDEAPRGITLKAAQTQIIDVNKKAVLTISDAGNLEVRWNGVWYSSLGYRGDLKVITLPDQISSLTPKVGKAVTKPKAKTETTSAEDNLLKESLN